MMKNEAESHEHNQHIHLKIEFEVDDVCQYDEVNYFIFELVGYFLSEDWGTMI